MKHKKLLFIMLTLFALTVAGLSAESKRKTLYSGGVYGWSFALTEISDGSQCKLVEHNLII